MLRNTTSRKFLATVFAGVYLFVALFSQNFHNHGSGAVYKEFHFKKSENTFTPSHLTQEFTDCLSCHFLHDGKMILPENYKIQLPEFFSFKAQIFAYQQRFSTLEIFYFQLRGPPLNFI